MSSFWSKALGVQPAQPAPHWNASQTPSAALQGGQVPGGYQVPQGLAVAAPSAATDQAGAIAAQQGYIKKPPEWMRSQPTDTCPECGGNSFATTRGAFTARCYECGYLPGRTFQPHAGDMTFRQPGNVQATRQPHSLGQNFGTIRVE